MNKLYLRFSSKVRNTLYHFRTANWHQLKAYNNSLNKSMYTAFFEMLICSWRHGASFENYYELEFHKKNIKERRSLMTTSLRHELTRQVNDDDFVEILKDKKTFSDVFHNMLGRKIYSWKDVLSMNGSDTPEKLIIKHRYGQAGNDIYFPDEFYNWDALISFMKSNHKNPEMYIFEEYISQHIKLHELNPSCVNTLRIITFYNSHEDIEVWGCYLRMGVGKNTDNLAVGGIISLVENDGITRKKAKKKNPFEKDFHHHPLTGVNIVGFEVPYYHEAIQLAKEAAARVPQVRSVGWDVAIGETGPCIIEGNDNSCMCLLQILHADGMRFLADNVCDMTQVYE